MIALLTTYLIVAYVLIPGVCFRTIAGFFVKLRLFQLTKTQEATFGVLVAVLPFYAAYLFVWHVPFARNFPAHYAVGTVDQYKNDRRLILTMAVSSDVTKLLEPDHGQESLSSQALTRIWHRQARFLSWYYFFSGIEGFFFAYLARKYGDWWENHPLYAGFARKILLPNISEWQLLLTDFNFPKKPKREVLADVLCNDHLYRGKVGDYFLDINGRLSGLYMKDVERFRRKDYEIAVQESQRPQVDRETFWRKIPGSNFYIPADKILNLNVRFPLKDDELTNYIAKLLEDDNLQITANYEDSEEPNESSNQATDCE